MDTIKYYIVDAFADKLFSGNQAGVCVLTQELDESLMQNIAAENNLSETAFVIKRSGFDYGLRWFTPKTEVDLCGHATLGTAYVISQFVDKDAEIMNFHTQSGVLTVTKKGDLFEMIFPCRKPERIEIQPVMREVIDKPVLEAWGGSRDLLLVLDSEEQIKEFKPDFGKMLLVPEYMGISVTAEGEDVDFVSRFFAPKFGILEDPVTGSAHSTLIPFWSERLGKNKMTARQLSRRGGVLYCEQGCDDKVDKVIISGRAKLYLEGNIRTY